MRSCLAYFVALFLYCANLFGQPLIVLDKPNDNINIIKNTVFYEDVTANLSFSQIQLTDYQAKFTAHNKAVMNFGNKKSAFWIKFTVQNKLDADWVLALDRAFLDSVIFYHQTTDGKIIQKNTGMLFTKEHKDYDVNYFVFKLNIPQDSTYTYYLRVSSNKTLIIPLSISTNDTALEEYANKRWIQGLFFGAMLLLILYNIGTFWAVRERVYMLYILYMFSNTIQMAAQNGFIYQYVTHLTPSINFYATIIYCLTPTFFALFNIEFLQLNKYKKLQYIHIGFAIIYILIAIGIIVTQVHPKIVNIFRGVVFFHAITSIIIGFIIWRKGYQPAKYYLIGTTVLMIFVIVNALKDVGVLPNNFVTINGTQFAMVWEVVFFSFALADKIYHLKLEKQEAKLEALQAVEAHAKLIEEQNVVLERKVTEKTKDLTDAYQEIEVQNEELKQQQEELLAINETLANQKQLIESQKEQIEATFSELKSTSDRLNLSIKYAQDIQQVVLPSAADLKTFFADFFAIYLPKDIVSGDFYWFRQRNTNNNQNTVEKAIFALADCTGHGVPGAFMTMVGNTLLHEIVDYAGVTNPAEILKTLNTAIIEILHQNQNKNSDGMDISICLLEKNIIKQEVTLTFAGAKTSIFYTQGNTLQRLSGDKLFLGGASSKKERVFTNHQVTLEVGETIYLFSDGFTDQNNKARESFGLNTFKELITNNLDKSLAQQNVIYLNALHTHQGKESQRDDITLVGLQL